MEFAIPEINGLTQVGNDPYVSEKVQGQMGEILLDFDDLQKGDDSFGRRGRTAQGRMGFQLQGDKTGSSRLLGLQIVDRLQALLMVLDDEMLEPFSQHGFDDGFVLRVRLNDIFDQPVDSVLGHSLGLALQENRTDTGLISFEISLEFQKGFQTGAFLIQLFPATGEFFFQFGKGND